MAPHCSTLAWKIPWVKEPGRLQSMGSRRVGHDWATSLSLFTFMHWRRKWQPTPVFVPGESQGRGILVAAVYGVTQTRTRLKRCSSRSSSSSSTDLREDQNSQNEGHFACFSESLVLPDAFYCSYNLKKNKGFSNGTWWTYSVQFSSSVVSDSLQPHESQHARPPCPSPTPRVHSDSCPSSQWRHPAISSSVVPFSSCPQSLPASESLPMSQLFAWGSRLINKILTNKGSRNSETNQSNKMRDHSKTPPPFQRFSSPPAL